MSIDEIVHLQDVTKSTTQHKAYDDDSTIPMNIQWAGMLFRYRLAYFPFEALKALNSHISSILAQMFSIKPYPFCHLGQRLNR